jgi:hypothetical protein
MSDVPFLRGCSEVSALADRDFYNLVQSIYMRVKGLQVVLRQFYYLKQSDFPDVVACGIIDKSRSRMGDSA